MMPATASTDTTSALCNSAVRTFSRSSFFRDLAHAITDACTKLCPGSRCIQASPLNPAKIDYEIANIQLSSTSGQYGVEGRSILGSSLLAWPSVVPTLVLTPFRRDYRHTHRAKNCEHKLESLLVEAVSIKSLKKSSINPTPFSNY